MALLSKEPDEVYSCLKNLAVPANQLEAGSSGPLST